MSLSTQLTYAILSMDSYNRGYHSGIIFGDNPSTNNYSDDSLTTQIGNATIIANRGEADAQVIGFYALAYEINGVTIISYRGTDDMDTGDGPDLYHGWSLGAGNVNSEQGQMAFA
jgi:hypothetical protein